VACTNQALWVISLCKSCSRANTDKLQDCAQSIWCYSIYNFRRTCKNWWYVKRRNWGWWGVFWRKTEGKSCSGARNKTIVFGILERKWKVSVDIVTDVSAKTLLAGTIKKVKRRSIVYTDKWRRYNSLMFSGYNHMSVDHNTRFANGKVYINGIEGFWSFTKERMAKHHGIRSSKFLLYIKEME